MVKFIVHDIYICIHVYIHTYMHVYMHMYVYVHVVQYNEFHVYAYMYHTYMYMYVCTVVKGITYIHTCTFF
jgi:hypothetical protein